MKRFTIAALMAVVLVCGVAVAALKNASVVWAGLLLVLTPVLLGFSILASIYRRDGRRAFWLGFALFGCGYMLIWSVPKLWDQGVEQLPTSVLLSYVHASVNTDESRLGATSLERAGVSISGPPGGPQPVPTNFLAKKGLDLAFIIIPSSRPQFVQIGHCLFALLFALFGAAMGRWLHWSNQMVEA